MISKRKILTANFIPWEEGRRARGNLGESQETRMGKTRENLRNPGWSKPGGISEN